MIRPMKMADATNFHIRGFRQIFTFSRQTLLLCLVGLIAQSCAADTIPNCTSQADKWIGNPYPFSLPSWVNRGVCVRSDGVSKICYQAFQATQANFDYPRRVEYTAATGVLVLLPTIGALLGAPTAEIWRLLTVIPFGGILAMTLSFGGVILPVRVKDYENDANGQRTTVGRSVTSISTAFEGSGASEDDDYENQEAILDTIRRRVQHTESQRLAKGHIRVGLLVMFVLWCGAQAVMVVIEQGAVVVWACTSRYWMHIWYLMVTATAIAENWVQVPFTENWRLYVSDIPYNIHVQDGDNILSKFENPAAKAQDILHQLASLRAARVTRYGSNEKTRPRNAVLVMISVANPTQNRSKTLLRFTSKVFSIAVFVTGTAIFASADLIALPVAVLVLTLILAAGIFTRAITGWIVSGISKTEPLIHIIVSSTQEAQRVIASILSMEQNHDQATDEPKLRGLQVELGGHIFVNQRRVGSRSRWCVRMLGVLAEPFDLRKVSDREPFQNVSHVGTDRKEAEFGLLQDSSS